MLKSGIKVFVNALTVFRCFFTFFMPMLIEKVSNITFIIIIGILFFTDCIDGFLSRRVGVQTLFGSIMDTIADKVLCIVLIFCISEKSAFLYVMMIGEILIATMNSIGAASNVNIVSIMTGKVKMWALALAIIFGYMFYFGKCDVLLVNIFSSIVIILQVFVLFGYGNKIRKAEKKDKKKYKFKKGKELLDALFDTEYYLATIDLPLLEKLTVA